MIGFLRGLNIFNSFDRERRIICPARRFADQGKFSRRIGLPFFCPGENDDGLAGQRHDHAFHVPGPFGAQRIAGRHTGGPSFA